MPTQPSTYTRYIRDDGTTSVCAVCGKRWGGPIFGPRDIEIARCDEHRERLTSAEVYAKGFSIGYYNSTLNK